MKLVVKMIKNKRGDIAITILVIGVIVLCTVALLSFYLIRGNQVKGVVNSVYSLQEFYNMADSVKYSKDLGLSVRTLYGGEPYFNEKDLIGGVKIKKEFSDIGLIVNYAYNP